KTGFREGEQDGQDTPLISFTTAPAYASGEQGKDNLTPQPLRGLRLLPTSSGRFASRRGGARQSKERKRGQAGSSRAASLPRTSLLRAREWLSRVGRRRWYSSRWLNHACKVNRLMR